MTKSVGFIGCGHMGGAMAQRLIAGGFDLIACDTDVATLEAMVALGASAAKGPRDVADRAEIILACLPSQEASRTVASAVAGGSGVKVYIETSTIGQATITAIAGEMQPRGISVLDMPVSGGPSWAREGRLTGILAGPAQARQIAAPVLNCIAGHLIVVGDVPGQGQIAKIVNNMLSLTGMMVACEAIVAGVKAGIDADKLLEVINAGTGRNSATVDKFPKSVLPRTFKYGGPIGIGNKDLSLYLELDRTGEAPTPLGQIVADLWQHITDDIGETSDLTEMVRYFEKRAGVEVRGGFMSETPANTNLKTGSPK
ncbi:MAG: NAD(P)-dependent oxidoreductase [Pseudorhodoplanes sp.]